MSRIRWRPLRGNATSGTDSLNALWTVEGRPGSVVVRRVADDGATSVRQRGLASIASGKAAAERMAAPERKQSALMRALKGRK